MRKLVVLLTALTLGLAAGCSSNVGKCSFEAGVADAVQNGNSDATAAPADRALAPVDASAPAVDAAVLEDSSAGLDGTDDVTP
jgi:hypothetical protein